jgi:adenylate cyclase
LDTKLVDKKVLIVDDEKKKREMLRDQLVGLGYTKIVMAHNVELGIATACREIPDIILLDINFGADKPDGFFFLRRLRQEKAIQDIPVVIVSTSERADKLAQSIDDGAADYFEFPVQNSFLRARIENLLKTKQRDQDAEEFQKELQRALLETNDAQQRADELLQSIFPEKLLVELKTTGDLKPQRIENVTVLFSDVVGFTAYSHDHSPEEVVEKLQDLVTTFEDVAERNGIEKIKTMGDAFMAAGGLFDDDPDVAFRTVKCGMEMIAAAKELPFQKKLSVKWEVRIGIHSGPVVAGKIGKKKYSYDIWGDTVNTAQRAEHLGTPGFVAVTRPVWEKIASRCAGLHCGWAEPKGKPKIELFRVEQIVDPPK